MTTRHGRTRYGYSSYGDTQRQYTGFDSPWYIATRTDNIRVDGVTVSAPPSPVVPGQTRTYDCVFAPQPQSGDQTDDHIERYERARDLLLRAPDVVTYDPPGISCSYREQHTAADGTQLVALGPLPRASDAGTAQGELPATRSNSIHEPRWAVVVGGETATSRPDRIARLSLEATTIATTETYGTRAAVRAARENNGF